MFYYKLGDFFKAGFFPFLCFLAISTTGISCIQNEGNSNVAQVFTDESNRNTDPSITSNANCRRDSLYSKEVSIRDLEFVDSKNVGEYLLQGKCELKNSLVYVTVNGYKTNKNPKCDRGKWKITLNLSFVSTEKNNIIFHITHNKETICKQVRVAFLGPKDYIPISYREDYYESGFYVMKYEAKLDAQGPSSKALSKPEERPATRLSYEEASTLCQNNGSRYDIMQNSQWQNIALSIEEFDENWSQGRSTPSDGNALNCGVFIGNPREASANDDDDCAVTSCNSGWDQNRRTHILSKGEKIWDICGNVGEIMKDKYRGNDTFDDYTYQLFPKLKALFGPKRSYQIIDANRRSNSWNLGYAKIARDKDLIVRGLPGREAGIFSVDITNNQVSRRGYSGDIGFRCVYIP